MAEERRSVLRDPDRHPVVTKKGLIKMCAVASNVGGALIEFEGEIKISFSHQKEKWVLLRDLYEQDGRLDHWEVFKDYLAARKKGAEVPPFPEEFLPKEVLKRRAGEVPGRVVWTPPTLKPAADERPRRREG